MDQMLICGSMSVSWPKVWGFHATPIREALARLAQEDLVQIVPRKGVFVCRKTREEILEMVVTWAALESMAARLATVHATRRGFGRAA